MPVGSHKDAFKAHQLVKRLITKEGDPRLAKIAMDILLDFVKHQRQVKADRIPETLPMDETSYETQKLDEALSAVDKLCGHCEESHNDSCFVNQTRRTLIAAKTRVDLGPSFDGKKNLSALLEAAEEMARQQTDRFTSVPETPASLFPSTTTSQEPTYDELMVECRELKEKNVFRATLIDEIMRTIEAVAAGNFAAEMPVHEDEDLGKLTTAFNLMLTTINTTMQNLDRLVAERSSEMRMIMNTVPVGLLSINEDFRINPEYSGSCEKILHLHELKGRDFLDAIGLTRRHDQERAKLREFLELFQQMLLPEEDMAPLNPFPEIRLSEANGLKPAWVKLNYHLINRGKGQTPHILVIIEDITRTKAMEATIAQSERENLQLKAIAEDPDLFCEFLSETLNLLVEADRLSLELEKASDPRPLVNEIFRGVHTIKGTAGAFNLDHIRELAAKLEESLSGLRQAPKIEGGIVRQTKTALEELTEALNELAEKTKKLLGQDLGRGGESYLRISALDIKRHLHAISAMGMDPENLKKEVVTIL
ncbi:MAG: Hpt domain-containing protein, partial [Deltaproteobacteria bacterium]|nr:Hpt domain-containing protein [Deltaproteobacteria bacterium]